MPDPLDKLVDSINGGGPAPDDPSPTGGTIDPQAAYGSDPLRPIAAAGILGAAAIAPEGPQGRAAGSAGEGQMLGVVPENQGPGLPEIAAVLAMVATLGLPSKAVTTAAGSTL